jgi:signal transduction histidine kinase
VIEISNRGPVIPPEQLPRIFERFYKLDKSRAKRRGESTGLGLAIARELIEAHKGTITVTSYPLEEPSLYPVPLPVTTQAEGIITFTISLPLLTQPAPINRD